MTSFIQSLIYFLLVSFIAYLPYKGKDFTNINWKRTIFLSSVFIIYSIMLLRANTTSVPLAINFLTVTIIVLTLIMWFLFPRIIRLFGKYPKTFLNNPKNKKRFIVRFELSTMTIKFFEVLFQQSSFLFILFIVLKNISYLDKIYLFTIIIAIFHLGNFLFLHYKWVIFYFLLSIPMSLLFSILILHGYTLLTASIHLTFYMIFNARYWFVNKGSVD